MAKLVPAILFVCLGNICRSPMAEGAMRAEAAARGLELFLDSAGTGEWNLGEPPDKRAISTAAKHGVDISGLRARLVQRGDFHRFDYIFALDKENLRDLQFLQPGGARAKLSLLRDLIPGEKGLPVPDPYYGTIRDFEAAWDVVATAAGILADKIEAGG